MRLKVSFQDWIKRFVKEPVEDDGKIIPGEIPDDAHISDDRGPDEPPTIISVKIFEFLRRRIIRRTDEI
jgi:hypothetical protein